MEASFHASFTVQNGRQLSFSWQLSIKKIFMQQTAFLRRTCFFGEHLLAMFLTLGVSSKLLKKPVEQAFMDSICATRCVRMICSGVRSDFIQHELWLSFLNSRNECEIHRTS